MREKTTKISTPVKKIEQTASTASAAFSISGCDTSSPLPMSAPVYYYYFCSYSGSYSYSFSLYSYNSTSTPCQTIIDL